MLVKFKFKGNQNVGNGIYTLHRWGKTGMEHVDINRGEEVIMFLHPADIDLLYRMDSDSMSRPKDVDTSAFEWTMYTESAMSTNPSHTGEWDKHYEYYRVEKGTGNYVLSNDGTYVYAPGNPNANYNRKSDNVYYYNPDGTGEFDFDDTEEAPEEWYTEDPDERLVKVTAMAANGAATMRTDEDTYNTYIKTCTEWRVGTTVYLTSGEGYEYTGSSWVPVGAAGTTVDFQFPTIPDPTWPEYKGKVIQYIGDSGEGKRDSGDLDPDIGTSVFRGDWIHSTKIYEYDEEGKPILDPDGNPKWHQGWEVLLHQGQIIEVDTLSDSNWTPKEEFLGYRIYLTKPYDDIDPVTHVTKAHYTRGWYQIVESLKEDGSSYNPKSYKWTKVLNSSYSPQVKKLERYTSKPNTWWIQEFLDIVTEEDKCSIKFRAHWSEALQNRLLKDSSATEEEKGYQYILLEGIPLPVPAAKKTYEAGTDSPYMAADLEVEVTDDGILWKTTEQVGTTNADTIYLAKGKSDIGAAVLGINWSRVEVADKFTVSHKVTNADVTKMTKARYENQFKNEPKGILRIPEGAIPVSTIDVDITYDWNNRDFGPEDTY